MTPPGPSASPGHRRRPVARRVPPNWSAREWGDEIRAEASAAACQAARDYDPSTGIPFASFLKNRILARIRARYRQERAFADHCAARAGANGHGGHRASGPWLAEAIEGLRTPDRWLIEQIYLKGYTGAELARCLGVSPGTIRRRQQAILRKMRAFLQK